jgi:hypothetical protein
VEAVRLGFATLVFLPMVSLAVSYGYVVPNVGGPLAMVSAAFAALSIFGCVRVLHALVATDSRYRSFYSDKERGPLLEKGAVGQSQSLWPHLGPGIIYLVGCPVVALVIRRLAPLLICAAGSSG